jgi:5-aminolevulinate synthase
MNYEGIFSEAVAAVRSENRYRVFANLQRMAGEFPYARNHGPGPERVVVWCSNDYLAQSQNPAVVEALMEAASAMGSGSGGTRNISGTHHLHVALEHELAELHGKDAALLFTSGYVANSATLSLIGRLLPGCVIFSDALNHASIIDGIRQSRCERGRCHELKGNKGAASDDYPKALALKADDDYGKHVHGQAREGLTRLDVEPDGRSNPR